MARRDTLDHLRAEITRIEQGQPSEWPVSDWKRSVGSDIDSESKCASEEVSEAPGKASFDANSADDAYKRILRYLNAYERSEVQVRKKLMEVGYSDRAIEEAVERARERSVIDDARYADILIRSRLAQGKGAAGIMRELESNGINSASLDTPFDEYLAEADSEFDRALAFLKAHPSRAKNKRDGGFRKLVHNGFSTSVAAQAAYAWSSEQLD